jgi:CelD/BcsL family acetyltransferase involved in cellulose biosynthesis
VRRVAAAEADSVGRVARPSVHIGRGPGAGLDIDIVSDYPRFVAMEAEWNDAVERAGITHPFLRHEWLRTWWDCFGGSRSLHLIVVRDEGRIAAIAPFMRETVTSYGLPIRRLDLIHNDHTPRADVIVTGRHEAMYAAIWQTLLDIRTTWDVVQLSRVPRESPAGPAFRRLAEDARSPTGTWQGDVSPYLPLTGTWTGYHAALPAKFRSNLRNRESRLAKFGEPVLEILDDAASIAAARGDALRLEASGWKRESGTSICSDPAVERFYLDLAARATAAGWLRLMFLTVGGKRIATSYGSRYAGRLFLFKTGYDPEYAPCAPFKLLTRRALEHAYGEGLSEVDFLGDAEPWKLEWTEAARAHDWLYLFSGSVRARLLHWAKFQMGPELKRWRA